MNPFLSIYTPTSRRPRQLVACMESVRMQTAVDAIEHVLVADHVGIGIGEMFLRIPFYADACHGEFVFILADDDRLASPSAVEELILFARDFVTPPPVIICDVENGGHRWPSQHQSALLEQGPILGQIGLGCTIVRSDVWLDNAGFWGGRYEGDFDFLEAVYRSGHKFTRWPYLFSTGPVSRGAAEPTLESLHAS
jgi:hypothetical protein